MKKMNLRTLSSIGWLIVAAMVISLSGCAAKKAVWGSMKKGMIMKYQLHPEKSLKYQSTQNFEQVMEVMEQEFTITGEGDQLLEMMPLVDKNDDLEFLVSINAMYSKLSTPRGEMTAVLDDVIGKSFNLTISPWGNELEYSGAEAITYDYGMGDTKNLSSDVQTFFPNLPDHPIMIGDSWETTDKITENSSSGVLVMQFTNINTFEKIETLNDYECMKINVVFKGTLEGEGEQDGMELITTGDIEGTATWYFAYKEGIFVSQLTEGTGKSITEIKGPQEMTLPATRVYTLKTELVDM